MPPAARVIGGNHQPPPIIFQPLDTTIYILLPCASAISKIVCRPFCRRHSEVALQLCPCLHNQPSISGIRIELLRRIAAIREVAVARFTVVAKEKTARAKRGRNFNGRFHRTKGAGPDLRRAVRFFRLFRHHIDDAADERPRKARWNIAAVDLDAFDVADRDRRDIDGRVTAQVRQNAVNENADLCRCRPAHRYRRILPFPLDLAYMDPRHHLQEIRQRLLLALKFFRADDRHRPRRKLLLPVGALGLNGNLADIVSVQPSVVAISRR